jgi:hypothetical protein
MTETYQKLLIHVINFGYRDSRMKRESRRAMGGRARLASLVAGSLLALSASPAWAGTDEIIAPSDPDDPQVGSGWQAGTCEQEPPEPGVEFCSVDTPDQFFEDAAGHPQHGFTQFIVKPKPTPGPLGPEPVGEVKTVRVDLPVGLSVNPQATVQCPLEDFEFEPALECPPESKVGVSIVTGAVPLTGLPVGPLEAIVYNVEPVEGEAARFGLELGGQEIFLRGDVAWDGDYHEGFTIDVPKTLPDGLVLKNRLVFKGRSGDGTFLTTPSTCLGEAVPPFQHTYSTWLLASSWEEEATPGYQFPQSAMPPFESRIPPGTSPKKCASVPYEPSLNVETGTAVTDSPAGAVTEVAVPHIQDGAKQDSSNTSDAVVALPAGMGLNPSAAHGLETCADDQFGKGTRNPVACPAGSRIGSAAIETPPLPPGSLEGDVFAGEQRSRDPESGEEYRIFVRAVSARYGVDVRLIGKVRADARTGQLTTAFASTPQVPFTSVVLDFDDGPRAVLSSPSTCGPHAATSVMTPWAPRPAATPSDQLALTTAPGGGPCAKTPAERPFAPAFELRPRGTRAGAYSPVGLRIARGDGQQELKGVDVTLAPGMTGKLAGIPYCPAAALAAAAANAGAAEQARSSCPGRSQVGVASTAAGTGPSPLRIDGKVFLAGPYRGAPLSLAVVTPATAGPFDLGTAVVRVALLVDPDTAQIRAVSDPIPHVFGGAQLSIRAVDVDVDRRNFTLNPTSCEALKTTGALSGGGGDPASPAAFSAFPVGTPFRTSQCEALEFKPKLLTRLIGGRKATRRTGHPRLRAVLAARAGDANIGRAALTLPHSQFLDQSHIRTICTRVQLAARDCPKRAIYGYARAITPLLDEELKGPVYLVSSDNLLPDLLADLHGQVNVRLRGVISTSKARIKTVFNAVPDVPVSRFALTMKGGKRGLIVNSRDLCAHPSFSFLSFKAQNGKKLIRKRLPLKVPSCGKPDAGKRR